MYHLIYETTNLINGKKYRGYHSTLKLEDGYLGSGPTIVKAILKHGKENFKREILEFCESIEEMIEMEKFYVDKDWVKSRDNYNMQVGGRFKPIEESTKVKIRETLKEKYRSGEIQHPSKGKRMTKEYCENMSRIKKGIPSPMKGVKTGPWSKEALEKFEPWNKGKVTGPLSDDHKNSIGKTVSKNLRERGHHNKGKKIGPWSEESLKNHKCWNRGIPAEIYICPFCLKHVGGKSNFNRWHNNNCKMKVTK